MCTKMKAYIAKTFSEEEGPDAIEGKTVTIQASKQQITELAEFLAKVAEYVKENDNCHMHFRDNNKNWSKDKYIDVAVNLIG